MLGDCRFTFPFKVWETDKFTFPFNVWMTGKFKFPFNVWVTGKFTLPFSVWVTGKFTFPFNNGLTVKFILNNKSAFPLLALEHQRPPPRVFKGHQFIWFVLEPVKKIIIGAPATSTHAPVPTATCLQRTPIRLFVLMPFFLRNIKIGYRNRL